MKLWYSKDEKEIDKYKYLIMLDLDEEELHNLSRKVKVVSKFMSAEEDNRKIENSLRKQYINEGIEQNKLETAKLMKEKGIDSSLIKEITGIDVSND